MACQQTRKTNEKCNFKVPGEHLFFEASKSGMKLILCIGYDLEINDEVCTIQLSKDLAAATKKKQIKDDCKLTSSH